MKNIHSQEKEQFKKLFKQRKIDRFEDSLKILDVFLETERHVTANELIQLLHEKGYDFDPNFVRDTLKLMCRFGFVAKNRFKNGEIRYEHLHLGHHHDHMICTKCKRIFEFEDEGLESLQAQIAKKHGFHMLQHRMEIYGICSNCIEDRVVDIPLTAAKSGEQMVIKSFSGGTGARMRLSTMGLRLGDEVEVVTNQGSGQVVVSTDGKRYALGRGLAKKVLVGPIKG
ncbi:MAG: transcriptional repressor [Deltaproteobacteria bacterium]|nr:transcriptional repressor [Deltaproteobacteria bacterium]